MTRVLGTEKDAKGPKKTIREVFTYKLLGTLQEEVDGGGVCRFRFLPEPKQMAIGGSALLRFSDDQPAPGKPPVEAESSEIRTARPFLFQAGARGQDLTVGAGEITVQAEIKSGVPLADPKKSRSVLSIPLPPQTIGLVQQGKAAVLKFQGQSLWALAEAKAPFTAAATVVYDGPSPYGECKGRVEVQFKLGVPKKPQS